MVTSRRVVTVVVTGLFVAVVVSVILLTLDGGAAVAQNPPVPCACSRATAVIGTDEVSSVPGQFQARFGIVHCQCGAATCVSQIPFASGGVHQLACVK
jgi:hypothetical protein